MNTLPHPIDIHLNDPTVEQRDDPSELPMHTLIHPRGSYFRKPTVEQRGCHCRKMKCYIANAHCNEEYHDIRAALNIKDRTPVNDNMIHYGIKAYRIPIGNVNFIIYNPMAVSSINQNSTEYW